MREYEYILTLLVAAAVTYVLTPAVRRLALKINAITPPRARDVHAKPIPRMGGLAMYIGVAAGLLVANQIKSFQTVIHGSSLVSGLPLAASLIVIIGIIDDKWGLNAIAKLAGQVAAAGVLVAKGAMLFTFPLPNGAVFDMTHNEAEVVTIVLVVATINAVNFIDGLDGLAAGIVCIAAISFFFYYYSLTKVAAPRLAFPVEAVPALAAILLAGACIGFLPHNFHPARIFMGDTGSYLLGLLLAYVPISAISQLDLTSLSRSANRYAEILPFLLPAAVMVIPYTDLLRAVIRRSRAGQSPLAADRKHLHHRMLDIGHSHRSSVLILYAWAALFAGAVVGLSILATPLLILAGITLIAVLVLVLLSIPRLRWWERDRAAVAVRADGPVGAGAAAQGTGPAGTAPARPAGPARTAGLAGTAGPAAGTPGSRPTAAAVPVLVAPAPAPVPAPVPPSGEPQADRPAESAQRRYVSRHGAPEPPTTPDVFQAGDPDFRPAPEPPAGPPLDETRPDLLGPRARAALLGHEDASQPPEPDTQDPTAPADEHLTARRPGLLAPPGERSRLARQPGQAGQADQAGQAAHSADGTSAMPVTRASGSIIP